MQSHANAAAGDNLRCALCRVSLTVECLAEGVCANHLCQSIHRERRLAELARRSRDILAKRVRKGTRFRNKQAAAEGVAAPKDYYLTFLTDFQNPVTPLPDERREEFRGKLQALVAKLIALDAEAAVTNLVQSDPLPIVEILHEEAPAPQDDARLDQLSGAVCAACRGTCCRQGETHAYLGIETLRRVMGDRPELQPEQLVDAYLELIPERTFAGSCVFHQECGCALPREMRAAICNEFFCNGLHDLRHEVKNGAPHRAFVIIRNEEDLTKYVSGKFIDEENISPEEAAPASRPT